jgi:hypothetical protein
LTPLLMAGGPWADQPPTVARALFRWQGLYHGGKGSHHGGEGISLHPSKVLPKKPEIARPPNKSSGKQYND